MTDVNQVIKKFNETKKMMKKMMPAAEDMLSGRGKKGKKGKRSKRRGLPGLGGLKMSDLKQLQDMMNQ